MALAVVSFMIFGGSPTAASAATASSVENGPCPVKMPPNTTCGFLLVPERRDVPNSRTIKVAFAVHRSTAAGRKPDPVVYTSGGPGLPSLDLTKTLSTMVPDRDVVVIDQRGGRNSLPRLACPEIVRGVIQSLKSQAPVVSVTSKVAPPPPLGVAPVVKDALACQTRLAAEHIDLRGYQTSEMAADVVDLRKALGYPQWNLFGVGYSTRTMLLASSQDPQGTRSVVLDSFQPAQAGTYDQAFPALAATMTKLGVGKQFTHVVAHLNAHPILYQTPDPLTHKRVNVGLTGDEAATVLAEALHEPSVISMIPALVDGMATGRPELLQPLVDQASQTLGSYDWGLYYAVQCQDEVPFNKFTAGPNARMSADVVDTAICGAWRLPAANDNSAAVTPPVTGGPTDAPTDAPADAATATNAAGTKTAGTAKTALTAQAEEHVTSAGTLTGAQTKVQAGVQNRVLNRAQALAATAPGHTVPGRTVPGRTVPGRTVPVRTATATPPVLIVGGEFDATTPPDVARQAAAAVPGARFTEFAETGHEVFQASACGRQTITAFLDNPASPAAPCQPGKAAYPLVKPGDLFLTSSGYTAVRTPGLLAPMALFGLVSSVQLVGGLAAAVRRRKALVTALAGLAGVLLVGLSAYSVWAMPNRSAIDIGVPRPLLWYGLLSVVSILLSMTEAFRLRAKSVHILPVLMGLIFVTWLYGWFLV